MDKTRLKPIRYGRPVLGLLTVVTLLLVLQIPIVPKEPPMSPKSNRVPDWSNYSSASPGGRLRLLFIHHSCGGQWLAPLGTNQGRQSIYESSDKGGGLRPALEEQGYEIHEASYGSRVGDRTDLFDWWPKFRDQMPQILQCAHQDEVYSNGESNQIVVFKSCFPNSFFVGEGKSPGNPLGPELTVANAQAAYRELLPLFENQPQTLFVVVTAPPLVLESIPLYKSLAKWLLGRPSLSRSGVFARKFNNWLKDPETGWLANYSQKNVAVFDYFDVLTEDGKSNFLRFPSGPRKMDNHPSSAGNQRATEAFIPFLNQAVRRSGLVQLPHLQPSPQ